MVGPSKKRSRANETSNSISDESKLRKKRTKTQSELNNFRALTSHLDTSLIDQTLVETFVKLLKSSLFMHHSRLMEIAKTNLENERIKGVCQLLEILRRPPAVHSFLTDMVLLFLKPEEALEMNCFDAYRCRIQALEILLKAQQYQRIVKGKGVWKTISKSIRECELSETNDSNAFYDSTCSWLGSDSRLRDFISPLFPDQPFDASKVSAADMETVNDDHFHNYGADEFEVVNWTDAYANANEPSAFRQCTCSCHQDSTKIQENGHCGLCAVKFFGEHVYVWRGSRLARAQIDVPDLDDRDSSSLDEAISPSKVVSLDATNIDANCDWEHVYQAIDAMENDDVVEQSPKTKVATARTLSTTPRKLNATDDSTQDFLKQAFLETFGRNVWGRGYSPMKRPGPNYAGIGLPNEESNSTSYVFVRGSDGANTMLAPVTSDSNSGATTSYSGASFENPNFLQGDKTPLKVSTLLPGEKTPVKISPALARVSEEDNENGDDGEEETWTEEDDRYLLEQFKVHGNVYEAGTAAMTKLQKSRYTVRDRLKLLLELLKEAE